MTVTHKNRVKMTVSGTPGTGTITLGSASSGYQSLATAYAGNATVDALFVDGTAWEVARACTYTNSGTTLTRGTLEASSTGSAISLTSAAIVSIIPTAGWGQFAESALESVTPGGRLTLTSGTPVTTSDVTGATSVYYTPYIHDVISLWDGARWTPVVFTEQTLALGTVTSGLPYDVFGYLSSGALAVEKLAWTNGTTRATGVSLQDGRYCKTGDKTRLYLGTFYTTSTTATEDSGGGTSSQVGGKRFLWNAYNRVRRFAAVYDGSGTGWSYTSSTIRQANGASGNKVEFISGLALDDVRADLLAGIFCNVTSQLIGVGIGLDSTTAFTGQFIGAYNPINSTYGAQGRWAGVPAAGYHYLAWLESGASGCTYSGLDGNLAKCGLTAEMFA